MIFSLSVKRDFNLVLLSVVTIFVDHLHIIVSLVLTINENLTTILIANVPKTKFKNIILTILTINKNRGEL